MCGPEWKKSREEVLSLSWGYVKEVLFGEDNKPTPKRIPRSEQIAQLLKIRGWPEWAIPGEVAERMKVYADSLQNINPRARRAARPPRRRRPT